MIALIDGDPILYQAAWGRLPGDAKAHVERLVAATMEATFSEYAFIAVGSDYNFRNDFFQFYKKSPSRVNSKSSKPDWFPELKDHLLSLPDTVSTIGFEADDLIRIWANEATLAGDPYVVCSIDKDLDVIPGPHYNNKTGTTYIVTPEYAERFFWRQCLTGDSVDNIPGIFRCGPVMADNILAGATTTEEYKKRVINVYKDKHGDKWWEYLMSNARLLHIWNHMDDHFNIDRS